MSNKKVLGRLYKLSGTKSKNFQNKKRQGEGGFDRGSEAVVSAYQALKNTRCKNLLGGEREGSTGTQVGRNRTAERCPERRTGEKENTNNIRELWGKKTARGQMGKGSRGKAIPKKQNERKTRRDEATEKKMLEAGKRKNSPRGAVTVRGTGLERGILAGGLLYTGGIKGVIQKA